MKVIMVSKKGKESLVCESIDNFHGLIFCKLLNQNYSSKVREVNYKMVEMGYEMNRVPFDDGQMTIDEFEGVIIDVEND